jgi:transcriptional regulator with XRE-family HTH domain
MGSVSKKGLLERVRRSKQAREQLVESNVGETVAFQIRALRESREMTQTELAKAAGMTQNNLSRLESPEYGKHSVSSLKKIAHAFDVAIEVRFVPFSQYIDWLSGTPRVDEGISPEAMAVPSFAKEEKSGVLEATVKVWTSVIAVGGVVSQTSAPGRLLASSPTPQNNLPADGAIYAASSAFGGKVVA